jgi:hypothetical protein
MISELAAFGIVLKRLLQARVAHDRHSQPSGHALRFRKSNEEISGNSRLTLKENSIPVDATGRPDLSAYTDSAAYYAAMHEQALKAMQAPGYDARLEFARRVHGTWGPIAKSPESIPYAMAMLASRASDAREDGAAILAEIGKNSDVVEHLLEALSRDVDSQARDSIILALGRMKNRAAIPALAALIENENTDGDTRWTAVESLGRIVRKRFLAQPQPISAALEWLKTRPVARAGSGTGCKPKRG